MGKVGSRLLSYSLLSLIALFMVAPFVWMILTSLKSLPEVDSANPFPTTYHPENYLDVFRQVAFGRYFLNSFLVAGWVTLLQCITSAMAAYGFARVKWKGRDVVFRLYLMTLMVPGVVTMIPNYTLLVKLQLLDTYSGLILPASFGAFGTFLMRQFMMGIPKALDEAAEIDGATHWSTFWKVVFPLSRAGVIALGVFTFLGTYGSFFWPLVMIKSEHLRTLPIGMLYFDTVYGRQTNLIMAGSTLSVLPLIILFLFTQRYLVSGIQLGAVKG